MSINTMTVSQLIIAGLLLVITPPCFQKNNQHPSGWYEKTDDVLSFVSSNPELHADDLTMPNVAWYDSVQLNCNKLGIKQEDLTELRFMGSLSIGEDDDIVLNLLQDEWAPNNYQDYIDRVAMR